MKKLTLAIAFACISIFAASTTVIANEAAIVWNKGEGQNTTNCVLLAAYTGAGPATAIVTSAGEVLFECKIASVNEAPPDKAVRLENLGGPFGTLCDVVITPSGRANINCH